MNEKYRKQKKRDGSHSLDIRSRQDDAAALRRNSESSGSTDGGITDQNEAAFVERAKDNGLDLVAIAAEVAAEKETEETK